jgi:bifunctional polynucleotide phosphatase/kinase
MTTILHKINNPRFRKKMAAFDYDWTLVIPKDGRPFPKNEDDWQWYYSSIPKQIKKYYDDGYMICVFTNQSKKKWKLDQITTVMSSLDIPVYISIARERKCFKPELDIFKNVVKTKKIDKKNSFFVGDALGRKNDFSDSDKVFAKNMDIECIAPEKIFYDEKSKKKKKTVKIKTSKRKEIIVMVGYPGSGKSTIVNQICENKRYVPIHGDVYKTSKKMIKVAKDLISEGKSFVFDATNSSKKKRQEYIKFANDNNYRKRCVHVSTSRDVSYKRNKARNSEIQVPAIAYAMYNKYFDEPAEEEGFHKIIEI